MLEKTLENPLDCKEIQPVHPKGDQSWVFIGRNDVEVETPILWPPDAKSWLIGKDPDAGKDWGQEEKGMTEDETVGWHHWLDGHGFGSTLGVGDGQTGRPGVLRFMGLQSWTWLSDWTELNDMLSTFFFHFISLKSGLYFTLIAPLNSLVHSNKKMGRGSSREDDCGPPIPTTRESTSGMWCLWKNGVSHCWRRLRKGKCQCIGIKQNGIYTPEGQSILLWERTSYFTGRDGLNQKTRLHNSKPPAKSKTMQGTPDKTSVNHCVIGHK